MKFKFHHLEWGSVAVPHQVADQAAVFAVGFRAIAVRHASRLHYRCVVAHIINESDEPLVEAVYLLVQYFFFVHYRSLINKKANIILFFLFSE